MANPLEASAAVAANAPPGAARTGAGMDESQKAKLKESCRQFEAFFWEAMMDACDFGGSEEGGEGASQYATLMRSEVSRSLSKEGSLGIGDSIYRWMLERYGGKSEAD